MNVASAFSALATLVWLIFIGLIVLAVVRSARGQKIGTVSTAILVVGVIGLVITTLSAGLVFIQPEERGVVISAVAPEGYREQALQPGLNWIIPFLESGPARVPQGRLRGRPDAPPAAPAEGGLPIRAEARHREVRLSELAKVAGDVVDMAALHEAGVLPRAIARAKLILSGSVGRAFTVRGAAATKGARAAIEQAGGKIED